MKSFLIHFRRPVIKTTTLITCGSIFFASVYNISFFKQLLAVYPPSSENIPFIISVGISLVVVTEILLILLSSKYTTKPVLILIFLMSSLASYAMDSFGVVIDRTMILNIFSTNLAESADQLTLKMILYFIFLGVLPSIMVARVRIEHASFWREVTSKSIVLASCFIILASQLVLFRRHYASYLREHKDLRAYANPGEYLYSIVRLDIEASNKSSTLKKIGLDAHHPILDKDRELIIVVIGESARADRFSINGYEKETNPLLSQEDVISFSRMEACGTSTAVSIPCMFSLYSRDNFSDSRGKATENVLDILTRAGVNILWRDNNSDSKNVALRVTYEDFKSSQNNPLCDVECRDEGMLYGLQDYINAQKTGDILIVLHQMGNHGPAYYKRYPKSFEVLSCFS